MTDGRKRNRLGITMALIAATVSLGGCEYADRKDEQLATEKRDGDEGARTTTAATPESAKSSTSTQDGPVLMSETGEAAPATDKFSATDSAVTPVAEDRKASTKSEKIPPQRKPLPPIAEGPLQTVPVVDIDKYMGKWYEIARYDSTFQRGIVGVVAHYELDGDIIRVRNTGFKKTLDGSPTDSTAKAWVVEDTKNTQWKVQFIWPLKADYWVIDLGSDYEYAVVGQPKRGFLWILSRTPTLESDVLDGILRRLCKNGYDPKQLSYTPQPQNGPRFEVGGDKAASEQ